MQTRTVRTTAWVTWVSGETHGPGETHVLDEALADELVTHGLAEYLEVEAAADRDPSSGTGEQVSDPDGPRLPPAADSAESTTRVKGIGPVTATALAEAGIPTLAALAALDEPTLLDLASLTPYDVPDLARWRDAARDLLARDTTGA